MSRRDSNNVKLFLDILPILLIFFVIRHVFGEIVEEVVLMQKRFLGLDILPKNVKVRVMVFGQF